MEEYLNNFGLSQYSTVNAFTPLNTEERHPGINLGVEGENNLDYSCIFHPLWWLKYKTLVEALCHVPVNHTNTAGCSLNTVTQVGNIHVLNSLAIIPVFKFDPIWIKRYNNHVLFLAPP